MAGWLKFLKLCGTRDHPHFGVCPIYFTHVRGCRYLVSPTQRHGGVQEFDLRTDTTEWQRYAVMGIDKHDFAGMVKQALT
jgi:hypothetical protein